MYSSRSSRFTSRPGMFARTSAGTTCLARLDADRLVHVAVKNRELVGVFCCARRTVDATEIPIETTERTAEVPEAAVCAVGGLANADPRCRAAKRTMAGRVRAI